MGRNKLPARTGRMAPVVRIPKGIIPILIAITVPPLLFCAYAPPGTIARIGALHAVQQAVGSKIVRTFASVMLAVHGVEAAVQSAVLVKRGYRLDVRAVLWMLQTCYLGYPSFQELMGVAK
mmetsp:Transcript_8957/g.26901  ORF Transcript_8957/g.26901 Transcript_8957/m.26901 type:complete len:121 (+) Transcript_8957:489-851(+)